MCGVSNAHTVLDGRLTGLLLQDNGHIEAPVLVRTSRSSQNAQGGRTRPFRMMARAIYVDGMPVPFIISDVSEPFVVRLPPPQLPTKLAWVCKVWDRGDALCVSSNQNTRG